MIVHGLGMQVVGGHRDYTPGLTWPGAFGLGDATCPSLEQLQGITDITDPCQNPSLAPSSPSMLTCPSGLMVPVDLSGNYTCPPAPAAPTSPTTPANPLSSLPLSGTPQLPIVPVQAGQTYLPPGSSGVPVQASSMSSYLIYGGVAIAALLVISSLGGKRR